jgi:glycosyltransferase involved in cell wall biosynthesis
VSPPGRQGRVRVAYIGTKGLPAKGGAERVLESIVAHLDDRFEPTVYCDARYTDGTVAPSRARLVRIATPSGKHSQATYLFAACAAHAVMKGSYDLVHLHSVEAGFVIPVLRARYPVLATAHGSPTRSPRSKWGAVARRTMGLAEYPFLWTADMVTSVSEIDAAYMRRRYRRPVAYVPNGVASTLAVPEGAGAEILSSAGVAAGGYMLFAAGRIDPTKGCHLAIEAWNTLESPPPLLVVGSLDVVPEYGRELRRAAGPAVRFIPLIERREDLYGVVAGASAFIFPSLTEGMSMMLLEAAALGTPVVCSDISENRAVLGEHAMYFASGDAGELAEKVRWAIAEPEAMLGLADLAAQRVRDRLSWDRVVGQYEALYGELLR